jgi:hypothetical protein
VRARPDICEVAPANIQRTPAASAPSDMVS